VEEAARRFKAVNGDGPELTHRHFRRNVQAVGELVRAVRRRQNEIWRNWMRD
jgi:hypothetical protein